MRQRVRLDLGQQTASDKEKERFQRKNKRWAQVNRNKDAQDNPFIKAISPTVANYGDTDETAEELRERLENFEFGNFRGYFNYRNKAVKEKSVDGVAKQTTAEDNDLVKKSSATGSNVSGPKVGDDDNVTDASQMDERIDHLKEEWFRAKDVLDIGCNRGHITYALARKYNPKCIVGIDIDPKLISMANRDLHMFINESLVEPRRLRRLKMIESIEDFQTIEKSCQDELKCDTTIQPSSSDSCDNLSNTIESKSEFPISNYIDNGPISLDSDSPEANVFPNNLIFVEHNYVPSSDLLADKQKPHFDTIVCLSVTKWIHLNYRDEGLKRFFKRIYNHLNAGGLFILEAQPFDNYARRKRTSDRLKANYYSIQLKPEQFDEYLLSKEIGFKSIIYESKTNHQCAGFKRPLKVYLK